MCSAHASKQEASRLQLEEQVLRNTIQLQQQELTKLERCVQALAGDADTDVADSCWPRDTHSQLRDPGAVLLDTPPAVAPHAVLDVRHRASCALHSA